MLRMVAKRTVLKLYIWRLLNIGQTRRFIDRWRLHDA